MTKAKIATLASELGYEGVTSDLTKAEMITAFLAAQTAANSSDSDSEAGQGS